ncbi:MAG: protein phosphatase 2C domain-containing protein [Gammaproteobacteria bacterium]|jgi:serine/threonine protein phosphatase PrpC
MPFETAATSLRGDRAVNQDRCEIVLRDEHVLLLLADGMGGHERGELAAEVFVDSMAAQFRELATPSGDPHRFLEQACSRAHTDIVQAGEAEQPPAKPLTTGIVCLVRNANAWWAHAGDSRLYLLRDGRTIHRTQDHSMVEELIRQGEITESERESHPLRNYVTRAFGGAPAPPRISLSEKTALQPGDVLLLCSDGLWSGIAEAELTRLCTTPQLEEAVAALAAEAEKNTTPYSDNITLLVLRMAP